MRKTYRNKNLVLLTFHFGCYYYCNIIAWGVEETAEERPYPLAKSGQVRLEPCDVSGLILAREEAEAQRVLGTCQ